MSATRPVEVELKYRLRDIAAGERLLAAERLGPFGPVGPPRTSQLEDRYLDTADGAFARAGFATRLRISGGATLVTVKSLARGDASGLHRREELEGPADQTAGPSDWPASAARSLVMELCGDAPLVETVTIRQLRRKRDLRGPDGAIELSLDNVEVVARGRVIDRFAELEAELVEGEPVALGAIAVVLAADPQLAPASGSKLEAALDAVRATRPKGRNGTLAADPAATTPGPPPLTAGRSPGILAEDSIAEAGRKVLRFQFARMLAKEPGTRAGVDPEELHQMRVATRRMRAAWRVFGAGFRDDRTRRHRRGLRRIAARLGAVRDLDVLIAGLEADRGAQAEHDAAGLEPLLAAWQARRDDARTLLIRELESGSYRRFVDEFRVFVLTEGAGSRAVAPTEPHRIRDTAPSRIWAAFEHVRAFEPVLRWADVETLHEIRIAGKWLRYTLEFLRETLGPETADLIARVVALQDHLGLLNDAHVSASLARAFLVEHAGRLSEAETASVGRYLVDREREVARLRRSVGPAWRGVVGPTFRRRLGRAIAAL